jgi:hypothetical protein
MNGRVTTCPSDVQDASQDNGMVIDQLLIAIEGLRIEAITCQSHLVGIEAKKQAIEATIRHLQGQP